MKYRATISIDLDVKGDSITDAYNVYTRLDEVRKKLENEYGNASLEMTHRRDRQPTVRKVAD